MPEPEEEQVQTEAAAQTIPEPSGEPEQDAPHQEDETPAAPQSIPYARFKEVNDKAKASDERARIAEERISRLESQAHQATQQQPITTDQVFAAYEGGQITETQKDQWLMHLAKENAKQEFGQVVTQAAATMRSQGVVEQYAKAYPGINDISSPEFGEVKTTYLELLAEGAPATVTTQAKALRMTFGPIKPLTGGSKEHTRVRADTFMEGSGGGGSMNQERDQFRDVPERQMAHWKKMGYSRAQMAMEAKLSAVGNIDDYRRMKAAKK